ncbi:hypothetical protein EVAR_48429_1 [Eumeta japonica]|uniref:Uncharacterized protein n=1 Tax=Eumeta variegata TaxID=151549 RepID=A0A4C1XP68_EUMVA|nr:hypothetical protein EVAR_48429_1 [Eumeta japonica]
MPEWKGRVPLTRSHCERITKQPTAEPRICPLHYESSFNELNIESRRLTYIYSSILTDIKQSDRKISDANDIDTAAGDTRSKQRPSPRPRPAPSAATLVPVIEPISLFERKPILELPQVARVSSREYARRNMSTPLGSFYPI